jgi:hypothetical protein
MIRIFILLLFAVPIFAQERIPETGTFWNWAPPAAYHSAAVKVGIQGAAGSGIVIETTPPACWVLTNEHVISRSPYATITWQDGRKAQAETVRSLASPHDVALLLVRNPPAGWTSVPIASATPPVGTVLEMVGFGGPKYGTARPFTAPRVDAPYDWPLAMGAPSISGDSGSGILYRGHLVGINFGGPGVQRQANSSQGPIGLVYPASSGVDAEFLGQWLTGICGPYGCQPRISQPPGRPDDGQFYPPPGGSPIAPISPISPQPIVPTQPVAPVCPPLDTDKIVGEIVAKLVNNPALRGKDGKDGPPGKDGPSGPPGPEVSDEQLAHLAMIAAKIVQQQMPGQRVVIVNGDTKKILDDETYKPGEAIVIDFQNIINAANRK